MKTPPKTTAPLHDLDALETFVRQHRRQFDTATPAPDLWLRIEAELDAQAAKAPNVVPIQRGLQAAPRRVLRPALWQAAATIALLAGFFWIMGQPAPTRQDAPGVESANLSAYSKELANQDAFYTRQIAEKRAEIVALAKYEPALVAAFLKDLDELEANYAQLRDELSAAPNQEAVIQAMIQNLQLRIDVLTRQLNVLREIRAKHPELQETPSQQTPRPAEVRV